MTPAAGVAEARSAWGAVARMSYRLVKEESRRRSSKYIVFLNMSRVSAFVLGICLVVLSFLLLSQVENKINEPVYSESYSSTPTIIISIALFVTGVFLQFLAVLFNKKYKECRRSLRGTPELWQSAYIETGDLPFRGKGTPLNTDDDAIQSLFKDSKDKATGVEQCVALCPSCGKLVNMSSGICQECGKPIV